MDEGMAVSLEVVMQDFTEVHVGIDDYRVTGFLCLMPVPEEQNHWFEIHCVCV